MTVVGAITQEKVIAFDIIGKSMKGEDFKKFVKEHLVPELWDGAVVVMDRLRAHQVEGIKEMVEEVGAKVIYLSGSNKKRDSMGCILKPKESPCD